MEQDDLHLHTITLLELVQLHHGCGLPPPVRLYITFEPSRFIHRYNAILKEVSAQADEEEPGQEVESEKATTEPGAQAGQHSRAVSSESDKRRRN